MFIGLQLLHNVYLSFIPSFHSYILFGDSLVYGTWNASYIIYWLYVICLYPGIAASRQPRRSFRLASIPMLLSIAKVLITVYFHLANILVLLDRQSWSRYCNAKKFSLICMIENIEQVGEKHKSRKLQKKALHAQIC